MLQSVEPSPPRSKFVTVFAWISIIVSGLNVLSSLWSGFVLMAFPAFDELPEAVVEDMPADVAFAFRYFFVIFAVQSVVTIATFVASIGLFRRKEWARIYFIVLMAIAIMSYLGLVVLRFSGIWGAPFAMAHELELESTGALLRVAEIASSALTLAIPGWIIARLASERVEAEFRGRAVR